MIVIIVCFDMMQIVIDSGCATFAEIQKRGKDFWAEFELYAADLLVGVVVNVALVGLLAPYARIAQPSLSKGFFGRMQRAYGALPSRLAVHLVDFSHSCLLLCSFCAYHFIQICFCSYHFNNAI